MSTDKEPDARGASQSPGLRRLRTADGQWQLEQWPDELAGQDALNASTQLLSTLERLTLGVALVGRPRRSTTPPKKSSPPKS